MDSLFIKLDYAKKAVIYLLYHEAGLVDFHDLVYWAGEVIRLRAEIKKGL
jgi:hypothetical protein